MNTCLNCKIEIPKSQKYCGRSCAVTCNNAKRKLVKNEVCKACGTTVHNQTYCSKDCYNKFKKNKKYNDWLYHGGMVGVRVLRLYLIILLSHRCTKCTHSEWNGQPIPLEVEHIDGNSENNLISNLTLLCPNCHAQTSTYKNKNKGNGRHARRQRYQEGKSY
jgi:predicted nucleic acid-binding Zn ribbon protein